VARLYANENFPRQVVERLRELGHDVLTTQKAGRAGQSVPDPEVLAFATREQRAVLTINRRTTSSGYMDATPSMPASSSARRTASSSPKPNGSTKLSTRQVGLQAGSCA
jgi:hypothetical protein